MKQKTRTLALMMLSLMAVGCQKENYRVEKIDLGTIETESCSYTYYVDDASNTVNIVDEQGREAFIQMMLMYAEGGAVVRICNENSSHQYPVAKDIVTFTTSDKDAATAWLNKMLLDGYDVQVQYDSEKGVYNCRAYKE